MNDRRLRRVRDELATLVQERRDERERNAPCPECSKTLSEIVRIIEPGTDPCKACEARADERGVALVTCYPPGGELDTDDYDDAA